MKSLVVKILAVMADVAYIQKRGHNAEGNYNFAREADITAKLRESMIKNKLGVLPSVKKSSTQVIREGEGKQEKISYLSSVDIDVTLVDADTGESFTATFSGDGLDDGDKAVYKATTGAMKYALLKLFHLETGNDPEESSGLDGKLTEEERIRADAERIESLRKEEAKKQAAKQAQPDAADKQDSAKQETPGRVQQPTEQTAAKTPEPEKQPAKQEASKPAESEKQPEKKNLQAVIETLKQTMKEVKTDIELKGDTYMVEANGIYSRSFKRPTLEMLGFKWDLARRAWLVSA